MTKSKIRDVQPAAGMMGDWSFLGWLLALAPLTAIGATNLMGPNDIPPLRPPRAELPPTFWEQHGIAVLAGIVLFLILCGVLIWYSRRPKPPVVVVPATAAREALEALRPQPENGQLLSQVSQVLRHYAAAAFELEPGELNTSEFCRALTGNEKVGPELAAEMGGFLRACDDRKFKPARLAPPEPLRAVPAALRLIGLAEARLETIRSAGQGTDLGPSQGADKLAATK